jgi:hypothetical protein
MALTPGMYGNIYTPQVTPAKAPPYPPCDESGFLVEEGQMVLFPGLSTPYLVTGKPRWDAADNCWHVEVNHTHSFSWPDKYPCKIVSGLASKPPGAVPAINQSPDFNKGFNAGVAALREKLLTMKYDALKDGRLDLERFDIRSVEP